MNISYQETLSTFEQPQKKYDFNKDLYNNVFNEVYAKDYIGKGYILKHGNFKAYDVIDSFDDTKYEVKRDYWYLTTGNMIVEELYNVEEGKKGWIYHTKSDYLIWFITDYMYYMINMYKLTNHFFNNRSKYMRADIKQSEGFTTRNYLIQLEAIKDIVDFDGYYLVDEEYRITDEYVPCQ